MPVPLRTLNDALTRYDTTPQLKYADTPGSADYVFFWLVENASILGRQVSRVYKQKGYGMKALTQEVDSKFEINLGGAIVLHDDIDLQLFGRSVDFEIDMNDVFVYSRRDFDSQDEPPSANQVAKGMKPVNLSSDTGNFVRTITIVHWTDIENQFSASGLSSEGDGFMNAYLVRMIHSGAPKDVAESVLKAKEITEETFGLEWKDFPTEKELLIAESISALSPNNEDGGV